MKTRIILFLLCLCTLSAAGQNITRQKCAICGKLKVQCPGHEKKCPTCGKPLSKCSGHEKTCNLCGKVISKCPYKGKHPVSKPVTISNPTGYENGHGYVDLGLSVKWATCNVGANSPSDYGNYYAWGETSTKSNYERSTYKWCSDSEDIMTKYSTKSSGSTIDNKTTLDLSDDAAHVNLGGYWRMPTKSEQDELRERCNWKWTTLNGVKGYFVTSKSNGKTIFLPAAGQRLKEVSYDVGSYGFYMSSSLHIDNSEWDFFLRFYSESVTSGYGYRGFGKSVRAVCP